MVLDQALDVQAVIDDALKRPFIMFGMARAGDAAGACRDLQQLFDQTSRQEMDLAASAGLHYRACGAPHFALSTKVLSLEQYIYIGLLDRHDPLSIVPADHDGETQGSTETGCSVPLIH